jgi:lipoprotein-releasing system ATP-binding protein
VNNIVIKAEHITRRLTGEVPVTLVENASLEVRQGEFVVITGPSGSGKSSLLYLLGLLDKPDSGALYLAGENVAQYDDNNLARMRLANIGFVFQFHFLLPEFTALENVLLPMQRLGRLTDKDARIRAASLLGDLGLGDQTHKLPRQLSGGQSQRVAIARALANEPSFILADEPTGNLDTVSSANVQKILKDLAHTKNCAVIAVSHETHFAEAADRRIVIVDGKIQ